MAEPKGRYQTWLDEHDYTLSTPAWLRTFYRVGKRLKGA